MEEGDEQDRSKAALALLDSDVLGWIVIRLKGAEPPAMTIQGYVPTFAYGSFAEMLRRAIGALER